MDLSAVVYRMRYMPAVCVYIYIYIYIYVCMCVCVCVFVLCPLYKCSIYRYVVLSYYRYLGRAQCSE